MKRCFSTVLLCLWICCHFMHSSGISHHLYYAINLQSFPPYFTGKSIGKVIYILWLYFFNYFSTSQSFTFDFSSPLFYFKCFPKGQSFLNAHMQLAISLDFSSALKSVESNLIIWLEIQSPTFVFLPMTIPLPRILSPILRNSATCSVFCSSAFQLRVSSPDLILGIHLDLSTVWQT